MSRTVETAFSVPGKGTFYLDLPPSEIPYEGEAVDFNGAVDSTPKGVFVASSITRTYDLQKSQLTYVYIMLTQREK